MYIINRIALERRAETAEQERDDYKQALESKRENVRLIDVAMHGEENAAAQASACDLIGPARQLRAQRDALQERVEELEAAFRHKGRPYRHTKGMDGMCRDCPLPMHDAVHPRAALEPKE